MCDLIDLNSPDRKGFLSSRLASPLIPAPTDSTCSNYNKRTNEPSSQMLGKRESLENNPFDMVLHKTTEYIQKKDDPFEVTLEKALRPKYKRNASLRTCSYDFSDDYILKHKKRNHKLKMNKTLDEALINEELNGRDTLAKQISNDSMQVNLSTSSNDFKSDNVNFSFSTNSPIVPVIELQDVNLSILNQSIMNDTLFDAGKELNKEQTKASLQNDMSTEAGRINLDQIPISDTCLKVPKLRRSFSQGETISPKRSQYLNQISLIEPLRTGSRSSNSVSSNSLDLLNRGFWKSHSSGNSVFSSLSNVSAITKLNSVSSITSSSMMLSNGTFNRSFIESCSSDAPDNAKQGERTDFTEERNVVLNGTRSSMADLSHRFNKLKTKALELQNSEKEGNEVTANFSNDVNECVTVMKKDEECDVNDKLIDVDVFTPEMNFTKEHCKNSISDTSSDSVFLEGNKMNKSIFHEAKLLARTFEELALKTSSGSSIDDLITNNLSWTLELLPAFDDEALVDNLIELPLSPCVNGVNSRSEKAADCTENNSPTEKHEEPVVKKVEEDMKDIEMELIETISTEKRITAATLLSDLKNLVTTEKNTRANKLLENLEKVLGVNWDNNTELLTTCLTTTNNLGKCSQKSTSSVEIIKNVAESNMEYSQEDNLSRNSPEITESPLCANVNFNDFGENKCAANNQKNLEEINGESKDEVLEAEPRAEEINKEKEINDLDNENECENDSFCKTEDNSFKHEKMALELLANIGKLLAKQTGEHSTSNLLKNLGSVLNFASNKCNIDANTKADDNYVENQRTQKKSASKFVKKTHISALSKSANRFSLDLESKKQPVSKNYVRRSISVSQSPPIKCSQSPVMSKGKSASQLKEVTKRFPSDPGLVSHMPSKKGIVNNDKGGLGKEGAKTVAALELRKEKGTVKTKLKTKNGAEVANKRGPMKAILPIGNMQKRETIIKITNPSTDTVTPPKSHKIISSTPNSTDNKLALKKSSGNSKPVASSTPDAENSKARKAQSQITSYSKKRNVSCDISPVTTRVNVSNNNAATNSPKRISKLPSPKRTTPKRRTMESGIPKSRTPPVTKRLNSSLDVNQYERLPESPQRSLYRASNSQKSSPVSLRKNNRNLQQSPLRESNNIKHKVKPINLISKLGRHNVGTGPMDKENNV